MQLYGLDTYTHYPFAIKNMNDYSLDALGPKLDKKEVNKIMNQR